MTSMNSRPVSVPRRGPGGPVPLVPAVLALVLVSAWGCGKPPMHQVQGVVRIGGKPVEGCKVGFFPDATSFDPTRHGFGFGITDAGGGFVSHALDADWRQPRRELRLGPGGALLGRG